MKEINKKGWTKITFGEVCKNLNLAEREPLSNGIDRYIGLEHIETENLHIKNWGDVAQGTTFTKKFLKGHVLFGKRRAYLKKAAIANFNGICSGDILVFDANEKKIHKNLFPFLVSSSRFFDFAVQTSAGSLSPRTKFQDLSKFEFFLPPMEQQAKLAELLWVGDEAIEKNTLSIDALKNSLLCYCEAEYKKSKKLVTLGELGEFYKGRGIQKSEVVKAGIPCVRYGELYTKHHYLIRDCFSFISEEVAKTGFKVIKDDILFAGSGETIAEIGKSATVISDDEIYAGSDIIVFRPLKMNGIFLSYLLNGYSVRRQLDRLGKGATVAHIYASDLKTVKINYFNRVDQDAIAHKIENINFIIENNQVILQKLKQIQKQLIIQIFG